MGLVHPQVPAIDLTPQVRSTLTALRPPQRSQRGINMAMREPLRDRMHPLDLDAVRQHLGIEIPTFPSLQERGYSTICASIEGQDLFAHPVPSTSRPGPLPPDPGVGLHHVLIVHTPAGVDPWGVAQIDYFSQDVCWMSIDYGFPLLQPHLQSMRPVQPRPVPHKAPLVMRDGTAMGVSFRHGPQTRMGWRAEVIDASFVIEVALPLEPLEAAEVLAGAGHIPLHRL